jgi:SanA protein
MDRSFQPALGWIKQLARVAFKFALIALAVGVAFLVFLLALRAGVSRWADARIYDDIQSAPDQPIAIVFGAGVYSDGRLSQVLADRVQTGVDLYFSGSARKLLMTGDNRFAWYNEPGAMGTYAIERGVPAEDIVYDYAGRRTYDSCYRARHIFGITQAILVTQEYHLPRALYTAHKMGIDVIGMPADRRSYSMIEYFKARELLALSAAWWDTNIRHPIPVMGDPIEIHYSESE